MLNSRKELVSIMCATEFANLPQYRLRCGKRMDLRGNLPLTHTALCEYRQQYSQRDFDIFIAKNIAHTNFICCWLYSVQLCTFISGFWLLLLFCCCCCCRHVIVRILEAGGNHWMGKAGKRMSVHEANSENNTNLI